MSCNSAVNALLTDLYQITMAYAYFKAGRHQETATFDLFLHRNPFGGEFTVFAGLSEVEHFVRKLHFSQEQIGYLKEVLPNCDPSFFDYLSQLDGTRLTLRAVQEGSILSARVPLISVTGELALAQLVETPLLNLVNYASLVATNAARFRLAAGPNKKLLEFGLRRSQGPDGGLSASRYSYIGGFDGTSNLQAGMMYGIPVMGTHAHSFVSSYADTASLDQIPNRSIDTADGKQVDFVALVLELRPKYAPGSNTGELAAFIAYAQVFPTAFLALVDTYDTLGSGVPNFICVALALVKVGYRPRGIRLDSGDLAYLSKQVREQFKRVAKRENLDWFARLTITASNEINESVLAALEKQGHEIDAFGIGTHLVTCQAQPALNGVYKLVEINGKPCLKISQDKAKRSLPGNKQIYRLYSDSGVPLADVIALAGIDEPPEVGKEIHCYHPFDDDLHMTVAPARVQPLLQEVSISAPAPSLESLRERVRQQLSIMREDHLRSLNPTPYKVSVTRALYDLTRELWRREKGESHIKDSAKETR